MRRTRANRLVARVVEVGLGLGLAFLMMGCQREVLSSEAPSPTDPPGAAPAMAPVPSQQPVQYVPEERERFRQTLARRFDVSQMVTQQLSGGDGVLHVPNGYVAHAMVAVKEADGRVRGHCLSSSAEVEALMKQSGADQ
jgi:hypothetical protein